MGKAVVWFRGQAWSGERRGAEEREELLQEFLRRLEERDEGEFRHSRDGEVVLTLVNRLSADVHKGRF